MKFQTLAKDVEIAWLAILATALVIAIWILVYSHTFVSTVSWNG